MKSAWTFGLRSGDRALGTHARIRCLAVIALGLTIPGCASIPDWQRNAYGIWQGPDKCEVTMEPLPATVSRSDRVERLGQIHRVHPGSSLVFTAHQGVCVYKKPGDILVYGFNDNCWVVGEFHSPDWERALSSHPIRQVAELSTVAGIPSPVSMTCSTLRLNDGFTVSLPPEWHWLDEAIGMDPEFKPNTLVTQSTKSLLVMKEFRVRDARRPKFRFGYTGFTKNLLVTGEESVSYPEHRIGFCYPRKDEWVVFYYSQGASATDSRLFGKLLAYLKPRVSAR